MKKYRELSAEELEVMGPNELRNAYGELLSHHIDETGQLYAASKARRGPSVIVIGPDRVGKTTVVSHISKILNIPSFKCPAEKQIFKQGGRSSLAFDYTLTHFIEQTGVRFISDRGYPCEWVYSKVFGRETDDQLLELIDTGHEHIGTKILYLWSSTVPHEEDDLVPSDRYFDVVEQYDKFRLWSSCRVYSIDTSEMLEAFKSGWDTSFQVARKAIDLMELK